MKKIILLLALTTSFSAFAQKPVSYKDVDSQSIFAISRASSVSRIPVYAKGESSFINLVTYEKEGLRPLNNQSLVIKMSDSTGVTFNVFDLELGMELVNSVTLVGTDIVVTGMIETNDGTIEASEKRIQVLKSTNSLDFLDVIILK